MASRFERCLAAHVKAGEIDKRTAADILDDWRARQAQGANFVDASLEAGAAAIKRAEEARDRVAGDLLKLDKTLTDAGGHKKGRTAGTRAIFSYDPWGLSKYESVEGAQRAMRGILEAKFDQGIGFLKSKTLGLTADTVSAVRFVREFFGETTGDGAAQKAAKAWKETDRFGVAMRKAEGSNIADTLPDYLPQSWNEVAVQRMGKPAFVDWMMARFDDGRLRMVDFETGRPLDRDAAAKIVGEAFDTISSNGMNKLTPGQRGGKKLANAHQERRVFHWATADAWLDFNRTFGYGDAHIFESLMGHISEVAREYGLLRVLGGNPELAARTLIDAARKDGTTGFGAYHLEAVYDQVSGKAHSPVSQWLARWGGSVAQWLRSAQLGSATLSAVGDYATLAKTADFAGLDKTKVIARYLEQMNPSARGAREQAIRLGLGSEDVSRSAGMSFRDGLAFGTHGLAAKFSDVTMKASLLTPHTAAVRRALGMEMLSHLTQLAQQNRAWGNLPGAIERAFERHGIGEAEWAAMKAGGLEDMGGVTWLHPEKLAKGSADEATAAIRLMSMVNREMDMAAPIGGAFERAILQGKSRPGSLVFEFLVRPIAMYKTYPLSIITHHGFRMASTALEEGWGAGAAYASLFVTLAAAGALAIQAKSIAQGKDPMNMGTGKFWLNAIAQGGGLGIFGDYLNANLNRADQSFFSTLAGPQWNLLIDLDRLSGGNINALARDKDTHAGREAANLLRRYTPGSSLWYTRLALDRLVWDQIQKEIDPGYHAAFRRTEDRARKEFGQEHWWHRGATSPARAPEFEAAIQ